MLGNWSFRDYFKKEAIEWAWELLTKVYELPVDRIYAGLLPDHESRDIWLQFLPPARVLPFGCKDNFWEMGDTGPCGPCTEIHYDRVGNRDAASLVNNDDLTCLEIWNLVFIQATGARPYSGKIGLEDVDRVDMAYRVVADHIRTLSFAIADGSRPGNEGREYVLRRILRRAVRYGKEILKAEEGFFNGLVSSVIRVMGDVFTELKEHEKKITEIIKEEEASFCKTLAKGIEKFRKAGQSVQGNTLSGEALFVTLCNVMGVVETDAFILWATYGFPIDLTQLMAEEQGLLVDVDGFNKAMKEARDISKNAQNKLVAPLSWMLMLSSTLHKMGVSATNDSFKYIWFQVDYERRKLIAPNHTCTHMLNFALKEVLGDHIDQKGSIVLPEKLRYDFSHGTFFSKPVDPEDLRKIESIVNTQIKDELEVYSKESVLSEAKRIKGLRAVFGEVYPDPVRVVAIGRRVEDLLADPENDEWSSLSSEFCGEEGIAKGIRRIIAVTTKSAFDALNTASLLEKDVDDTSKAVGNALEKKVNALKRRVDEVDIPAAKRADIKAKIAQLQLDVGFDAAAVRGAVSKVMQKKGMSVMVFSTDESTNKAVFKQLDVTEWLTIALSPIKGKCGKGKSGLASGQGTDASQVSSALDLAASFASMNLN
ncbi:BnaC05g50520D [Brassica napus]|uniref:alanine--tRNA ligase n=1 Tax=Brassica napus TaxID=3708 RepID=A0A078IAM6_BRANA|nr:BnaC05g50520D [Brassica napus]